MSAKTSSSDKRREILRKAFRRAENPTDSFSKEQLHDLHQRLASHASVLRVPENHRKILEMVTAIEAGSGAPQGVIQRESQGMAVHMLATAPTPRFMN